MGESNLSRPTSGCFGELPLLLPLKGDAKAFIAADRTSLTEAAFVGPVGIKLTCCNAFLSSPGGHEGDIVSSAGGAMPGFMFEAKNKPPTSESVRLWTDDVF